MTLYIKNMVCRRCKMAVTSAFQSYGIVPLSVELGEVETAGDIPKEQLKGIDGSLRALGFELIADKKGRTIEKIKTLIISQVHGSDSHMNSNLSALIASHLHQDYNYLSNLFSEVEGTTIEKYFISQRIEKAKELLVYDELTLSQIADQLGYSSVSYLSGQFKKLTGFTPSHFKTLKEQKRRNIDDL